MTLVVAGTSLMDLWSNDGTLLTLIEDNAENLAAFIECCCDEPPPATCCGCLWLNDFWNTLSPNRMRADFISGPFSGYAILKKGELPTENGCYYWTSVGVEAVEPIPTISPSNIRQVDFSCISFSSIFPTDINIVVVLVLGATCVLNVSLTSFVCDEDPSGQYKVRARFTGVMANSVPGDCAGMTGDTVVIEFTNMDPWPP